MSARRILAFLVLTFALTSALGSAVPAQDPVPCRLHASRDGALWFFDCFGSCTGCRLVAGHDESTGITIETCFCGDEPAADAQCVGTRVLDTHNSTFEIYCVEADCSVGCTNPYPSSQPTAMCDCDQ